MDRGVMLETWSQKGDIKDAVVNYKAYYICEELI